MRPLVTLLRIDNSPCPIRRGIAVLSEVNSVLPVTRIADSRVVGKAHEVFGLLDPKTPNVRR